MPVHDVEEMFNLKTPRDEVLIALPYIRKPRSSSLLCPSSFTQPRASRTVHIFIGIDPTINRDKRSLQYYFLMALSHSSRDTISLLFSTTVVYRRSSGLAGI